MDIVSERVKAALNSKKFAVYDFFGGWNESDIEQLKPYAFHNKVNEAGFITDWLGIRTRNTYHLWMNLSNNDSPVISDLPIPDDSVHADAIEYIAMAVAIERELEINKQQFIVFELGASYGPWLTASSISALRMGFENVMAYGVEASESAVSNMLEHASKNLPVEIGNKVFINAIHGAVTVHDGSVYFPNVDVSIDNGGQVTENANDIDYRGLSYDYKMVNGYSLNTLLKDHESISYLHMDLQGIEEQLLTNELFIETLTKKVSTVFLATQSRYIEGLALRTLPKRGWFLYREKPTIYKQNNRTTDINGWTLRDGGQIWLNKKFSSKFISN